MKRRKPKKLKRKKERKSTMEAINLLKQNVRAYHNNMTEAFINAMGTYELLANCHPLDREQFAKKLNINLY